MKIVIRDDQAEGIIDLETIEDAFLTVDDDSYIIQFDFIDAVCSDFKAHYKSKAERDIVWKNIKDIIKPVDVSASAREIYNVESDN